MWLFFLAAVTMCIHSLFCYFQVGSLQENIQAGFTYIIWIRNKSFVLYKWRYFYPVASIFSEAPVDGVGYCLLILDVHSFQIFLMFLKYCSWSDNEMLWLSRHTTHILPTELF